MNRLCCFLSGGHRYTPSRTIATKNPFNRTIVFNDFCVKCGKLNSVEIPIEHLEKELEKEVERFKREWRNCSK